MPPIPKKSPFAPWVNATLTFTIDRPITATNPAVRDPDTGNAIPQKQQIILKCILNPVRLVSAKRKDNNPGADTNRIGMTGYLVEPFQPNLPAGIEPNAIADCVIEVKQGSQVIERKVGKLQLSLDIQSAFYVSPITGASISGDFFL